MKIYIAGHRGMVGNAIWDLLKSKGHDLIGERSSDLDLRNQQSVMDYFKKEKPDVVIDAAARVGGILANSQFPYEFLMDNNLIDAAHRTDVSKFIFLGSSCIYPKLAPQPLKEEYLLTAPLEPTNEWYAIAKISGVKACEAIRNQYGKDFVSLMPTNLYGPFDNFDLKTSHVLPAMIRKFHDAKKAGNELVTLWGSGNPMREFLFVEDLADAVNFTLENSLKENLYNVGTGVDLTIRELAESVQKITGHSGSITWDSSKPDGTPRKLMDVNKLSQAGWNYKIDLQEGIERTYNWFLNNQRSYKEVKL
jgi:GDP-L-fucose synthase